jgi:hypothetical protein
MNDESASAALAGNCTDQRGFSLMEAVVATAIAVIAVLGLAHSFGMGRALIVRYELGRAALGVATRRMEALAARSPLTLPAPSADSVAFVYKGNAIGMESWTVQWVDDPYDGLGVADNIGGPNDLKQVTVTVRFAQQDEGMNQVQLQRMLPAL